MAAEELSELAAELSSWQAQGHEGLTLLTAEELRGIELPLELVAPRFEGTTSIVSMPHRWLRHALPTDPPASRSVGRR